MRRGRLDFAKVTAAALADPLRLLEVWLPDGRLSGHEFAATNPTRHDRSKGSFTVNVHTGAWADFADEQARGRDLISLYAYLHGCDQGTACRRVAEELGISPEEEASEPRRETRSRKPRYADADFAAQVTPVPDDAPSIEDELTHYRWGRAIGQWVYRDAEGRVLCYIIRWWNRDKHPDREGKEREGKENRQLTLWRTHAGNLVWRLKWLQEPRPPYNWHLLAAQPERPVIFCEGEKAADAAHANLGGWIGTTTMGGASNARKNEWEVFRDRPRVVIWEDADGLNPAGGRFARAVYRHLKAVGVKKVAILSPSKLAMALKMQHLPDKFDAADIPEHVWADADVAKRLDDGALELDYSLNDHNHVVESIERYWESRCIEPDALGGFRYADSGNLVEDDAKTLVRAYLLSERYHVKLDESYVTQTWEALVARGAKERRSLVVKPLLGHDESEHGVEQCRLWVRAVTGRDDDVDLAVFRHWIWMVKRQAAGLSVREELMPVLLGCQGCGKSWSVKYLVETWQELTLQPVDATFLTDERKRRILAQALIALWDEMQGASKSDVEAIKQTITAPFLAMRPLNTNSISRMRKCISWIGTSNKAVASMVQDTTGARRFYELRCVEPQVDFATIDPSNGAIDYGALWREGVDERDDTPIAMLIEEVRARQEALIHHDEITMWLTFERDTGWHRFVRRLADAPLEQAHHAIPEYDSDIGYSLDDLHERFASYCSRMSLPAPGKKILGPRLRGEEGFTTRHIRTDRNGDACLALRTRLTHQGVPPDRMRKLYDRWFVPSRWFDPKETDSAAAAPSPVTTAPASSETAAASDPDDLYEPPF